MGRFLAIAQMKEYVTSVMQRDATSQTGRAIQGNPLERVCLGIQHIYYGICVGQSRGSMSGMTITLKNTNLFIIIQ